jgi:hypothetical protein
MTRAARRSGENDGRETAMFVCVKCNRQMRPKKNGFEFVELIAAQEPRGPGGFNWKPTNEFHPHALWSGDLWECQDCGNQVVYTDIRQVPITSSYQPNFAERSSKATVAAKPYTREARKP